MHTSEYEGYKSIENINHIFAIRHKLVDTEKITDGITDDSYLLVTVV